MQAGVFEQKVGGLDAYVHQASLADSLVKRKNNEHANQAF